MSGSTVGAVGKKEKDGPKLDNQNRHKANKSLMPLETRTPEIQILR